MWPQERFVFGIGFPIRKYKNGMMKEVVGERLCGYRKIKAPHVHCPI